MVHFETFRIDLGSLSEMQWGMFDLTADFQFCYGQIVLHYVLWQLETCNSQSWILSYICKREKIKKRYSESSTETVCTLVAKLTTANNL